MGGSLGFTLREENGTEHRLLRWTNSLSWMVNNLNFINKNPDYIQNEILNKRHDYEIHQNNGLCPASYGLFVVDFQTNTIIDMQDATDVGLAYTFNVRRELKNYKGPLLDAPAFSEENSDCKIIKDLYEAGKIIKVNNGNKDVPTPVDLKELFKTILTEQFTFLKLDFSPFKVLKFLENEEGSKNCRAALKKLGFKFSKRERENWDNWLAELKKECEEAAIEDAIDLEAYRENNA